jgi:alpha-glucosidase
MRIHHDRFEPYVSSRSPRLGETVALLVRVPVDVRVSRLHLRRSGADGPVFASAVVDGRDAYAQWWRSELTVRDPITTYRFLIATAAGLRWLTGIGLTTHDVPDATDFWLMANVADTTVS